MMKKKNIRLVCGHTKSFQYMLLMTLMSLYLFLNGIEPTIIRADVIQFGTRKYTGTILREGPDPNKLYFQPENGNIIPFPREHVTIIEMAGVTDAPELLKRGQTYLTQGEQKRIGQDYKMAIRYLLSVETVLEKVRPEAKEDYKKARRMIRESQFKRGWIDVTVNHLSKAKTLYKTGLATLASGEFKKAIAELGATRDAYAKALKGYQTIKAGDEITAVSRIIEQVGSLLAIAEAGSGAAGLKVEGPPKQVKIMHESLENLLAKIDKAREEYPEVGAALKGMRRTMAEKFDKTVQVLERSEQINATLKSIDELITQAKDQRANGRFDEALACRSQAVVKLNTVQETGLSTFQQEQIAAFQKWLLGLDFLIVTEHVDEMTKRIAEVRTNGEYDDAQALVAIAHEKLSSLTKLSQKGLDIRQNLEKRLTFETEMLRFALMLVEMEAQQKTRQPQAFRRQLDQCQEAMANLKNMKQEYAATTTNALPEMDAALKAFDDFALYAAQQLEAVGWLLINDEWTAPTVDNLVALLRRHLDNKNFEDARICCQRLTSDHREDEGFAAATELLAEFRFRYGRFLESKGQYEAAREQYELIAEHYPETPVAAPAAKARFHCSTMLFMQSRELGIIVCVVVLVVLLIGIQIYRTQSRRIERRFANNLAKLKKSSLADPSSMLEELGQFIDKLEKRAHRFPLEPIGAQTLIQAYRLNLVLLTILKKEPDVIEALSQRARKSCKLDTENMTPALADYYLKTTCTTPEAIQVYHDYLFLERAQTQTELVAKIVALLEKTCRISEDKKEFEPTKERLALNMELAMVPGSGTRLVIQNGIMGGRQYTFDKEIHIGAAGDDDIVLQDESLSGRQVEITPKAHGAALKEVGTGKSVYLNGEKLAGPCMLKDGDEVRIGTTRLVYYNRERAMEDELSWPLYHLGLGYLLLESYAPADAALSYVAERWGDKYEALWHLGRAREAVGNIRDALATFQQAIERDSSHHDAYHAMGQTLLSYISNPANKLSSQEVDENIAQAVECLGRAVSMKPKYALYHFDYGRACKIQGDIDKALKANAQAIALEPDHADYQAEYAEIAYEDQRLDEARAAARKALEVDESSPKALYIMGCIDYSESDFASTIVHFDKVRTIEARENRSDYSASPAFVTCLGRAMFETGKYVSAIRLLEPHGRKSRDACFTIGRCYANLGQIDDAFRLYNAVLKDFGHDPETLYYQASLYGYQDQFDMALHVLEDMSDDNLYWLAKAHGLRARIAAHRGDAEATAAAIQAALDTATDAPEINLEAGILAMQQGIYDTALQFLKHVQTLQPGELHSIYWTGRLNLKEGRKEEAEICFRNILDAGINKEHVLLRPLVAGSHRYYALIQASKGDLESSLHHLLDARNWGEKDEHMVHDLACLYAKLGRFKEALAEFDNIDDLCEREPLCDMNRAAVSAAYGQQLFNEKQYRDALLHLDCARTIYHEYNADDLEDEVTEALVETCFRHAVHCIDAGGDELGEGVECMEKMRELRPDDSRMIYLSGVACFKQECYDEAMEFFRVEYEEQPDDITTACAVALTHEHAGNFEETERVWILLCRNTHPSSQENIRARLGLAGYYSRREEWTKAAEMLENIIMEGHYTSLSDQEATEMLGKLAASFYVLARDHESCKRVLRDVLGGINQEQVAEFVGALCAKQGLLQEAWEHLLMALTMPSLNDATQELFEAVSMALAAQQAAAGNLKLALEMLEQSLPHFQSALKQESVDFKESVRNTVLLSGVSMDISEDTIKAYRSAFEANPKDLGIMRNYAIVTHRFAIQLEEQGKIMDADKHWREAHSLWKSFADNPSRSFWRNFMEAYNTAKSEREQIKENDLDAIRKRVLDCCRDIHVELALLYEQGDDANVDNVKRHAKYAATLDESKTFLKDFSMKLMKPSNLKTAGMCALIDFIMHDLHQKDSEVHNFACLTHLNMAVDQLWQNDVISFQQHMLSVQQQFNPQSEIASRLGADFAKKADNVTRTSSGFVSTVVREAKYRLALEEEKKAKSKLFDIVMVLCTSYCDPAANHDELERNLLTLIDGMTGQPPSKK